MAGTTKVEFDVLAHDRASDKLDRIAKAFRRVGQEADDVKRADGLDELSTKLKKVAGEFDREGNKSGKSFGSSLKKWFTGEGGGLFTQIGKDGGSVFGSGLLGALKTPILGPALVATVGAAAAVAMPLVGAIAGGALVTGFGAGLAGLGLVFAAKNEEVKKTWTTTLTQLGADMELLAKPFQSVLINIAGYFKRTVDAFNPYLSKAFARLAQPVDDFVNDAAKALEGFTPAIAPITDAFNAVLRTLGPALQGVVRDVSAGLVNLADSVEKNPDALADMVDKIGKLSKGLLDLTAGLNTIYGKITDFTGSISGATGGLISFGQIFGIFKNAVNPVGSALGLAGAGIKAVGGESEVAGASMSGAANETVLLAQGLNKTGTDAQHAAPKVQTLAEKIEAAGGQAAYSKQQFEGYISAMFKMQNLSLGLAGAQVNLQAAIDDAAGSVKENGRTLDINTEKGRNNKTALINLAQAANAQTEAMERSSKGDAAAAKAAENSRANFVKLAMQMGKTKPQAEAMARSMIAIPNVNREAKLKADKTDLEAKLRAAKAKLADPKLTATKKAKLSAEIGSLQRQVNAAQTKINSLHGKTVTITTVFNQKGVALNTPSGVGRRAAGGPVKKGTPYIVGEHRPELFVPNENGTIIPRIPSQTHAASASGGSAQPLVVQLVLDGKVIQQSLLKLKRDKRMELGLA